MLDTNLINEENTRDQLRNALVDVFADNFVDLLSQLVRDLGHFWLHQLTHHAHNILSSLWSRIGDIKIVQCDILNNLLLLVYISFGDWYILLGLQIKFRCVCIRSANALACSSVCFNVDDIPNRDSLLLYGLVDAWI